LNSSLFDRVRIRPSTAEAAAESDALRCDHPGCQLLASYRAPKGRQREGQYFRFCLTHVQEYNKGYNYFAGMKDDEVSAYQKVAITGHRPTWTLGVNGRGEGLRAEPDLHDPLGLFERLRGTRPNTAAPEAPKRHVGRLATKALDTLGLDANADKDAIRARYKALVKRLHPDANGGDRSREDKLREIINAYNTLKSSGLA
jgi:curved DNA-binding protein CbpA